METVAQVRHLLALSQFGNFRRAADHLNISQPSLSQSIKRVEDIYGVPLFERNRSGVIPTVYGEVVLEKARRSLDLLDEANREIDMIRNYALGRLVIGCEPHLVSALAAPALSSMITRYPKLKFSLEVGTWSALEPDLENGAVDLFFGFRPDGAHNNYTLAEHLLPRPVIYARKDHPFIVTDDPQDYVDQVGISFIRPPIPEWYYQRVVSSLSPYWDILGQEDEYLLHSGDAEANKIIVGNSDAISATFYVQIVEDVLAGKLEVVPEDRSNDVGAVEAVVLCRENKPVSPALQGFLDALKMRIDFARELENRRLDQLELSSWPRM